MRSAETSQAPPPRRLSNVISPQALRARDRPAPASGPLDLTPLAGTWVNTETRRRWLAAIDVRVDGGQLRLHPRGGDAPSPADWGERAAEVVCAGAIDATDAGGCVATFPLDAMDSELHATLNQGLLVVVAFNRTHDPAAAPGLVTREFFRRAGDQA
jgi:hypothetical protein